MSHLDGVELTLEAMMFFPIPIPAYLVPWLGALSSMNRCVRRMIIAMSYAMKTEIAIVHATIIQPVKPPREIAMKPVFATPIAFMGVRRARWTNIATHGVRTVWIPIVSKPLYSFKKT